MGLFIVLRLYSADIRKEKLPIVGNSSLITNLWTEFWFSRAPSEIFSKWCFLGSFLPFWSDKIDFSPIFDSFLKILNADSWSVKNFSKELIISIFRKACFLKKLEIFGYLKNIQKIRIRHFWIFRAKKKSGL